MRDVVILRLHHIHIFGIPNHTNFDCITFYGIIIKH